MKGTRGLLIFALAVPIALGSSDATSTAASSKTVTRLLGHFEATVYGGPDRGLTLRGTLRLRVPRSGGGAVGTLTRKNGSVVPVSGQIQGHAVNLFFQVGGGRHIFGVGTAGYDSSQKRWAVGGPLVGPRRGDSGDWDYLIKGGWNLETNKVG